MGGSRPPPLPRPVVEPARQGRRRGWLRLGALVVAGVLLALFIRRVVPADTQPTSEPHEPHEPHEHETSGMLRPSPQHGVEQPEPERAEETPERTEGSSEQATQEPSEVATQEASERLSFLRSRAQGPRASSETPEPSVRQAGRYQSEQLFASTEQIPAFADARRGPRRSERSYRLDVESASITRSDTSAGPTARLSVNRVRDTLRRSAGQLEQCCDAALRASLLRARAAAPHAAPAAQLRIHGLSARFSVEASGATSGVRLEGNAPDELITCIRSTIERWKLPGVASGVEFRVGLELLGATGAPSERR
jgi:hypothetical protein